MALNQSGVAAVALAEIANQDVQKQLADQGVILNSVLNLSPRVGPGMKSIAIPRVSGLTAHAIPDDGTDSSSSGMTVTVDTLSLTSKREITDYIYDTSLDSAVDLKAAFFDNAPGVFVQDIEAQLYAQIIGASASAPDHILQMSGAGNVLPTIADIRLAAQRLDEQKLPQSDRFLLVTPAIKAAILAFSEVSNASAFGQPGATMNGQVGELYGFKILVSNQCAANTMVCYHKSALAFAMQKDMTVEMSRIPQKAADFVAIRSHYGQKVLNSGKFCILFNATGT
jgi:Phage capsid protein